jgi:ubiquinone/menaquinone biosynthesis C-methylase UbiE
MFWDKISGFYDVVMKLKNGKVNKELCKLIESLIEKEDNVLECACGTGMISTYIARKCKTLIATDFSKGMLKQTRKKCKEYNNILIEEANIINLKYEDESFDKVVAGNVIHLLEEPHKAIFELTRVCKKGGNIIIPTYINNEKNGQNNLFIKLVGKAGANFKRQFTFESYKSFIMKYVKDVEFKLIDGHMPCAVAIIKK